jgi:mannose-6-phosphate isomerase-like protein (cupin superfamily)
VFEELEIGPGHKLRVLACSEEALELEATYAAGGTPPPAHLHPGQDERFKVLRGAMQTRIEQRSATLTAGEMLEVPRGTVHQMWNAGDEEAVVSWKTMPAGRTLDWFRELAALLRGESQTDGATLLAEYSDVFRLVTE